MTLDAPIPPEEIHRLDEPDADAWRRIRALPPCALEVVTKAGDPFAGALRAWRAFQDPDRRLEVAAWCTLDLSEALERCAFEPLGLTRAALEAAWARFLAGGSAAWLERVHAWIRDLPTATESRDRRLELGALAFLFRARVAQARGDTAEEDRLRTAADARLPLAPSAELLSRRLELSMPIRSRLTSHHDAELLGAMARRLPREAVARRVHTLILQARCLPVRPGQVTLYRALDLMPAGYALRVRSEIYRNLLQLAVRRHDLEEADRLLDASRALLDDPAVSDRSARAVRDWLLGCIALMRRRPAEAWDLLRSAARVFAELSWLGHLAECVGLLADTLFALENKCALEPTARRHDEARQLLADLERLVPAHSMPTAVTTFLDAIAMSADSRASPN
ncbi:MAG: hypothetical protein AAGC60_17735 [Acidobacteriota bacterium]